MPGQCVQESVLVWEHAAELKDIQKWQDTDSWSYYTIRIPEN